jgi:hypothetical protein
MRNKDNTLIIPKDVILSDSESVSQTEADLRVAQDDRQLVCFLAQITLVA